MKQAPLVAGTSDWAFVEGIADALGAPMPPGWWQEEVVQARQDHLAAVASLTASAFLAIAPLRNTHEWDAALQAFSFEMVALDDEMRAYTGLTARGDVIEVVQGAMAAAGGAALAELLVGLFVAVRGG